MGLNNSGIVLLAKKPGVTSFSSLSVVKKSLGTKKVGHTGTLDSFAQGLLVVCVGSLTRLCGQITAFDKEYDAVIEFGAQTDTLDPTGAVIKKADLPTFAAVKKSLEKFKGKILQKPPEFSAIKIGGRRASDLLRKGEGVEIPEREITVYDSELEEVLFDNGGVKAARVRFVVSKGTYIRSLARDIGADCNSAAHLAGLLRTRVGMFKLRDAAGANELEPFTIKSVIAQNAVRYASGVQQQKDVFEARPSTVNSQLSTLNCQLSTALLPMSPELAKLCGFVPATLLQKHEADFFNGRPLRNGMFAATPLSTVNCQLSTKYAVFLQGGQFAGVVQKEGGRFKYEFVIPEAAR